MLSSIFSVLESIWIVVIGLSIMLLLRSLVLMVNDSAD